MKIESHLENLKESIREINEAVTVGLEHKQRTLAFHASSGAIDILEIILHKYNLIDMGFMIKHEWFNSKNILEEKLSFDFPKKAEIIELMRSIESMRNPLCYGKRKTEKELFPLIENFNKLKMIFLGVTQYEI